MVFLQSPEFEVLKAINQSAVEAGVAAKTLTVSNRFSHAPTPPVDTLNRDQRESCLPSQDEELNRTCGESAKIQAAYGHYFDLSIVNDNLDETYRTVKAALETVSKNPQWVPVTWVF